MRKIISTLKKCKNKTKQSKECKRTHIIEERSQMCVAVTVVVISLVVIHENHEF